jgi:hypothetical protein
MLLSLRSTDLSSTSIAASPFVVDGPAEDAAGGRTAAKLP